MKSREGGCMKKGSIRNLSFKEGIMTLVIALSIFILGKWAYLFLPDEYAKGAQIPGIESIFVIAIALLFVYIYKIGKKIDKIEKYLEDLKTDKRDMAKD
jgi:hypothetical protein